MVSWHTCSLQNVSDECKNNNPRAKLETNTMKKCNSTKRSNLKHKNRTSHSTFLSVEYNVAIANSLAGSVSVCLRTRSRWMIIRNFSLSFGHFHFVVVDDWLVSDWRNFFGSNVCPAVNFKTDVLFACNNMLLFLLHDVVGDKKQKNGAYFTERPEYSRNNWRVCESFDRF